MKPFHITIISLLILTPISFLAGSIVTDFTYNVPFASCQITDKAPAGAEEIELTEYSNRLFRNFYGKNNKFVSLFAPKETTLTEYFDRFNNGGFHYLKTESNETYSCGLYK